MSSSLFSNPFPNKITKITSFDKQNKLNLDINVLRKILKNKDYINLPVVVYTIAGPYRSGKTSLLNLLHFYISNKLQNKNKEDIMKTLIPTVFESKGGIDANTTGIDIISKPFILDINDNSEKVALFLMDTQGLFDNVLSKKNETILGMLSFLLSSKQFFNIKQGIQSVHLDHIYKFAEKSKAIKQKNEDCDPLQLGSLSIVMRDFEEEEEFGLGIQGGKAFMKSFLEKQNPNMAQEHKMLREYLKSEFESMQCFLLPHPSRNIKKTSISISDLDKDFQKHLTDFCEFMLTAKNLIPKTIQGESLTCGDLAKYLESCSLYESLDGCVESTIMADTEGRMNILVTNITGEFLKDAANQVQNSKHHEKSRKSTWYSNVYDKRKSILTKLQKAAFKNFQKKRVKWVYETTKWEEELIKLLAQCAKAIEACDVADDLYIKTVKEFHFYLEKMAEKCKDFNSFSEIETTKKISELKQKFKSGIDKTIAEQCCEKFEENINKLLLDTNEHVENYFRELEKDRSWNTFLDIGRMVGGSLGVVAGATLSAIGLGIVVGAPLVKKAWEYLASGAKGENRNCPVTKKGDLFTLPGENLALKNYENGEILLTISCGEIKYPLHIDAT